MTFGKAESEEVRTYVGGDELLGAEVALETVGGSDDVGVRAHLVLVQHELARVVVLAGVAAEPTASELMSSTETGVSFLSSLRNQLKAL